MSDNLINDAVIIRILRNQILLAKAIAALGNVNPHLVRAHTNQILDECELFEARQPGLGTLVDR